MLKKRKQDRIKSSIKDMDLWKESGINCIYRCFELVGIFYEYLKNDTLNLNSFDKYYADCTQIPRYHYRNLGVKIIYEELKNEYFDCFGNEIKISKSSMRRFGITYPNAPVYVYESSYVIACFLIKYIYSEELLKSVFLRCIARHSITSDMSFQDVYVVRYSGLRNTTRKKYYGEMWDSMKNLLESE